MFKSIKTIAAIVICAAATSATADGEGQQPAYVNDMPFPAEMPVYTPRVLFADLPFHDLSATRQAAVFGDMPFPTQMKEYIPVRYYADMPTPADMLDNLSDQALLQVRN